MREKERVKISVFRMAVLLMTIMFAVLTGNAEIHAAQVLEVNDDTIETVDPTVTPTPTVEPVVTPAVKNGLVKEGTTYRYYIKGKMVTNWQRRSLLRLIQTVE